MDLIILVLVACGIGFAVWLLTTKIPMPPYWATAIQIVALILVILFLFTRLNIPNVLH